MELFFRVANFPYSQMSLVSIHVISPISSRRGADLRQGFATHGTAHVEFELLCLDLPGGTPGKDDGVKTNELTLKSMAISGT